MEPRTSFPPPLLTALAQAQHVAVLTGAGISAESGIPTFRDAQMGLWARYDPQELATPWALRQNPGLVWSWYEWRRSLVRQAKPNPGHRALVELESLVPRFTLITQNVDGLHQAAGSRNVIELHGNIMRTRCADCGRPVTSWDPPPEGQAPACPHCRGVLRPDVVFFGEPLPADALERALEAAMQCDVMLVVGTSAVVEPAASLPRYALQAGATVVEVNPQETPLSPLVHYRLAEPAGRVLPALVRALKEHLAQLRGGR